MPRSRKFNGYCEQCRKSICSCSAYQYVDGNNVSITYNSPYLCKECYEKKYNTKIKTDIEIFKTNLINTLLRFRHEQNIETLRIDKLIEYISSS